MRRPAVTVVGDALLDRDLEGRARRLAPDAPVPVVDDLAERARPGGAGLAAVLAARAGADVTLVTALADDEAGETLARLLAEAGVRVCPLALAGETPEKVRVLAAGTPLVRLDRGGDGGEPGALTPGAAEAIASADAVLVSDYGRGMTTRDDVRRALAGRPVVWDPHPRGTEPTPGALIVTPNASEAAHFAGIAQGEDAGRELLDRWRAVAVAVTRGASGALVLEGGRPALAVPAPPATGDPCGAGDCFAATAAVAVARGSLPSAAIEAAVRAASAFVAAGGAGALRAAGTWAAAPQDDDPLAVAARVRARGGTVVATGGCFDLLHAGHVRMLEAARAQGDCLVVLLNSDASVRRLKGPDRPLVPEGDRVAVLRALRGVDAVLVFEEDEPSRALERLRPDVWVKGGDYAVADLPEAEALATWGGRIVLVPYVAGRSTTKLIEEAVARAG
jgi:rfaE bifunctional protein nucleotidyltransferase chain/domain/rfaE bifunctional protein kinase chain/domain